MNILSAKDVCQRIGIGRTKLWQLTKEGRFPRPVTICDGRKGYVDDEVNAWIRQRIAERDRRAA